MRSTPLSLSAAFLFLVSVLVSCGPSSTPENTASAYIAASVNGDYQQAYRYVSAGDRQFKSLEQFLDEMEEAEGLMGGLLRDRFSYEVLGAVQEGDTATVEVVVTGPDFNVILGEVLGAAHATALSEGEELSETHIERIIWEWYDDEDVPEITETETLTLVREADGWKVVVDWAEG
jgi:hypothetical protein